MSNNFSRRVNLTKGEAFVGKLGRSGISGGLNPKHLRPRGEGTSGNGASNGSDPQGEGGSLGSGSLPSSIGDIMAAVDDRERDKIAKVTSKLRSLNGSPSVQAHTDDVSPYLPDFGFNPVAYDPVGTRTAYQKKRPRSATTLSDDPKSLGICLAVFFGSILLFMGIGQFKSCAQAKDALKIHGSIWEQPEPPTPAPAKSIFEVYPGAKSR